MGYPGGDGWVRWLGVGEIRRGGRLRQLSWRVLVVVTGSGRREVHGRVRWELGGGGGRVEWLGWMWAIVLEKKCGVDICFLYDTLPGGRPRSTVDETGYPKSPKVCPHGDSCMSGPE